MQTPNRWAQIVRQCCLSAPEQLPDLIKKIQTEASAVGFQAGMEDASLIVARYKHKRFADTVAEITPLDTRRHRQVT
jgi:hypothetical protein